MSRIAVIFAANEMARLPLAWWLGDHGFAPYDDFYEVHDVKGEASAYCNGVVAAVKSDRDMAVFCDNDMIPGAPTDDFFRINRYHVQCVAYPTQMPDHDQFASNPNAFHTGIWRASRSTLLTIMAQADREGVRLFDFETGRYGADRKGCCCSHFAALVQRAGLTIGHVGTAQHIAKPRAHFPTVTRYRR